VRFKWPLVLHYIKTRLFYPFIVFQLLHLVYTNYVFDKRLSSEFMQYLCYGFQTSLALLALYFLKNEFSQLFNEGTKYFSSFWNYIDVTPPLLILISILLDYIADVVHLTQATLVTMQAVTALFMWFKFLYFLRIY